MSCIGARTIDLLRILLGNLVSKTASAVGARAAAELLEIRYVDLAPLVVSNQRMLPGIH
jgi:hypothetical protein